MMLERYKIIYSQIVNIGQIRYVVLLSSASILAQIINILAMPLLTRLYAPSDFGVLSLFSSIVGLLVTISGFRYHLALPLMRRKRYVQALVCLSIFLQFVFILIAVIVVFCLDDKLVSARYVSLFTYRYLILICVFFIGIYTLAVQWAIREKQFSSIARTKIIQVIAANIVQIFCAFILLRPLGLLVGYVIGQSCGCITLLKDLIKINGKLKIDFMHLKRVAISYRNMCLIDTPGALLNMAGAYILPLIIAYFYTDDVVGSYSMAHNLLILPGAVVGQAIGQVFSQKAAEAKYNGTLGYVTGKTFELLARAGLFPVLLCSLLAPEIFTFILGDEWKEAGLYASILAPWLAVNFIYSPMSVLFTTLMIQRMALIFTFIYTITRLGSIAVFGGNNPLYAMFALSISGTIMMFIGVILLMVNAYVKKIWQRIGNVFGEALVALCPSVLFVFSGQSNLIVGLVAVAISVSLYVFFIARAYRGTDQYDDWHLEEKSK